MTREVTEGKENGNEHVTTTAPTTIFMLPTTSTAKARASDVKRSHRVVFHDNKVQRGE